MRTRAKGNCCFRNRARRESSASGTLFHFVGNCVAISYKAKALREDAHSREGKVLLSQPRSARGFRKRNPFSLLLSGQKHHAASGKAYRIINRYRPAMFCIAAA